MKPLPLLLVGFMGLFFSACSPRLIQATPQQRVESFSAYTTTTIDGQPITKYLGLRTSLLLRGDEVEVSHTGKNSGTIKFLKAQPGQAGTATAIDSRGYYLTAAHCIPKIPPLLFIHAQDQIHIVRPRVVWMGQVTKGQPDLALLHVPFVLDEVFPWAPTSRINDPVITTGYFLEGKDHLKTQDMAGKIVGIEKKSKSTPAFLKIYNNVPVTYGNSGGPTMDTGGKLIGITVSWRGDFDLLHYSVHQSGGVALRPDLKWLAFIIQKDQATLSPQSPVP